MDKSCTLLLQKKNVCSAHYGKQHANGVLSKKYDMHTQMFTVQCWRHVATTYVNPDGLIGFVACCLISAQV